MGREGGNALAHGVVPIVHDGDAGAVGSAGVGDRLGVRRGRAGVPVVRRRHLRAAGPPGAGRGALREDGPYEGDPVKAVVRAGGEGPRLRPLTSNQPKPMMPMANRPLMEHVVRRLAVHGIDDIVVTLAFLASHIRNYFGDGSELGVSMRYATEETPLGTAGSVRNAAAELDDTFMVISGDVLSDIDLDAVIKAHRSSGALATIALRRVENPVDFGIVITSADGWVERFLEKPTWGQVFSDTINTGIY